MKKWFYTEAIYKMILRKTKKMVFLLKNDYKSDGVEQGCEKYAIVIDNICS